MRATDFFLEAEAGFDFEGDFIRPELNEDLIKALRAGPLEDVADVSAAIGLLDLVHDELESYGTDGSQDLNDPQIELAIRTLETVTARAGVPLEVPFRDFTRFRNYWSRNGAHGSWQARRDILDELFEPARAKLAQVEARPLDARLPAESLKDLKDPSAILEHLQRIQRAIVTDPAQVIGSAKELIESTAKVVLTELRLPVNDKADVPALVKDAQGALGLHPSSQAPGPDGSDAVKKILGSVTGVAIGVAELRNRHGTGHGAAGQRVGLGVRHAHLAVNAAVTWCQLMLDTLADKQAPWRRNAP
ncbi:abortive infection family protein [Amycolatopsis keratiniphila]|nr:abortive infection family protein [Amycolatopsis keratiniphila]